MCSKKRWFSILVQQCNLDEVLLDTGTAARAACLSVVADSRVPIGTHEPVDACVRADETQSPA